MDEETRTCNQCILDMDWYELADVYYDVCTHPECPNYALLQVPLEKMPKKEVNDEQKSKP